MPITVARVNLLTCLSIFIYIVQRLIVAPHGCAEVGCVADTDAWRHAVAYHLYLVTKEPPRLIEAIECSV